MSLYGRVFSFIAQSLSAIVPWMRSTKAFDCGFLMVVDLPIMPKLWFEFRGKLGFVVVDYYAWTWISVQLFLVEN